MHVHLPKEAFKTFREFLKEMFTITCGVLIALSLEGIRHSMHERHLVKEARANILAEVRENREITARMVKRIPETMKITRSFVDMIKAERDRRRLKSQTTTKISFGLISTTTHLNSLSWSTAQSTGAVSLMGYQEVKRYKSIYEAQESAEQIYRKMRDQWSQVLSIALRVNESKHFDNISDDDLAQDERLLMEFLASIQHEETITKTLVKTYDNFLATQGK